MEYLDSDFEKMFLNVWKVKSDDDLFKTFPILGKYKEFGVKLRNLDKNKVIKYIAYAFDKNSPLSLINDIIERRVKALELAGFKTDVKENHSSQLDMMVHSGIPEVNHMVIRYCLFVGDTDYAILVTYEDSLVQELQRLSDFETSFKVRRGKGEESDDIFYKENNEKKAALITNISNLRKQIKDLRSEIFSGNIDAFLERSLREFTESERLELSPEFFAKQYKDWDNISKYYKN